MRVGRVAAGEFKTMGRTPRQITPRSTKTALGAAPARTPVLRCCSAGFRLRAALGRRYPGWPRSLPVACRDPRRFPWRASCSVKPEWAEQRQLKTRFRDLLGGLRPAARGVEMLPARHEKPAFSGGWTGCPVFGAAWLPRLDRARIDPRQSVASARRLTTLPPNWGTYAMGSDCGESTPGCVHRVDSPLRFDTIPWTDGFAHGTSRS